MGNTHENKENARPWEEHRDDYSNESAAAKLARKESLNIKLALRPDRQELINRWTIITDSSFLAIIAAGQYLAGSVINSKKFQTTNIIFHHSCFESKS